jgi:hypothetical protein
MLSTAHCVSLNDDIHISGGYDFYNETKITACFVLNGRFVFSHSRSMLGLELKHVTTLPSTSFPLHISKSSYNSRQDHLNKREIIFKWTNIDGNCILWWILRALLSKAGSTSKICSIHHGRCCSQVSLDCMSHLLLCLFGLDYRFKIHSSQISLSCYVL